MEDKEQQYNELLAPLAKQIYELAQKLEFPFLLAVQVSDETVCGSGWIPPDGVGVLHLAHAVLQGRVQVVETSLPTGSLQA